MFQTSADGYRVEIDGEPIDVDVDELGPRAGARLTLGDRTHHVLSATHGITHLVEVDGHAHRISARRGRRDPGALAGRRRGRCPVGAGDEVEPRRPVWR